MPSGINSKLFMALVASDYAFEGEAYEGYIIDNTARKYMESL